MPRPPRGDLMVEQDMQEIIVCSAPGRTGIVGNPTDMYGGTVISCSTMERATVRLEPWDELVFETMDQQVVLRNERDLVLDGGYFDIPRAVVDFLDVLSMGAKISYSSDVPFRAGLSSSTALLVAVLNAVLASLERSYNRFYLTEMTRHIELNYLKIVCGYQDHYMCTFGGLNYMDFRGKEFYRSLEEEPYATVESLVSYVDDLPFVIAHTGVERLSTAVHKPIRDRWLEGDREVVKGYLRIGHLARMGKKALLGQDWELLGELMNENHEIQRDLGGSGPENEQLIETALECGALGAKLAGGGKGGTIIALHLEPEEMIAALEEAGAGRILTPEPSEGVTVTRVKTEDKE